MGTPDFAVGVLKHLIDEGQNVVGVITAPDKPAGRGRKLSQSAIKKYAESKNLKVLQPKNLKDDTFLAELEALKADLQIVVAFRMLPKVVWAMPPLGTFNLHASLLPQYRGAAPINWVIMNGEKKTGVTTFFIDEKIDTGAILLKEPVEIAKRETAGSLHDKLMEAGSILVSDTVSLIESGDAEPIPQPEQKDLKPAPKLHPENTRIDWLSDLDAIDAHIRGLSPYPVAWTLLQMDDEEYKVKIYDCAPLKEDHDEVPGTVFASRKKIKVAVKDGFLFLNELQLPGKRKMDAISLLNGFTFDEDAKMS